MVNERFGDFERADAILRRVLERSPEEREAFIEIECGTDRALLERVRGLLETAEESGVLSPGGGLSARFWPGNGVREKNAFSGGERIGPWRIVEELGRGGMGVVYLAEREGDPGSGSGAGFEQRAALKLVKRGMDSEAILARFYNERQVLAGLEHPNIARLIDGGATEDGQPWFAMEYVEGGRATASGERFSGEAETALTFLPALPITDYCDQNRLSINERIALMIRVCEAVQYAHARLIIHRDLKPSNILVTKDSGPKLLDFGLAKVLHSPEGDATVTVREQRWMTLDYASPEQIRGNPVGTPSDTYQLGLILYELLTGQRAYSVRGLSPTEAERVICEQVPTRPSTVVQAMEEGRFLRSKRSPSGMPSHVQSRDASELRIAQVSPGKLRKRLKGDLDTILLKALHKDPARGYTTAEHLADDLHAHLEGRPVKARPDSVAYRMRKFVARHAVGVAATAGVIALTVALVAFYTIRLQDERDRARAEADKAEQVAEFLGGLFRASRPDQALGKEVTARDLLDNGLERIEALDDQSEIQAQMLHVIGTSYQNLGLYDEALPMLERAMSIRRKYPGDQHRSLASSLNNLGLLHMEMGNYDQAEAIHRETLAMRRELLGDEDLDLIHSLNNLALVFLNRGDYASAEPIYRELLALDRKLFGEDHRKTALAMNGLASTLEALGRYDEAEALYDDALAIWRKRLGGNHPRIAQGLNNLATLRSRQEDFTGAVSLYRESLAIRQAVYGDRHPAVALVMANLGSVLSDLGDYEAAEAFLREALAMRRELLGEWHADVAHSAFHLGSLLDRKGDKLSAEPLHREAVEIASAALGHEHWETARHASALGGSLAAQSRFDEAEPLLRDSYEWLKQDRGMTHPETRRALERLIALYEAWDKPERAEAYENELALDE